MKIIKIAQTQAEIQLEIRKQILTSIFDNTDGKRSDTGEIAKDSVEKRVEGSMGTFYVQVLYADWDDLIIVDKYYESEFVNNEYGKTIKIKMDYDNPQVTISKANNAIAYLME